MASKLLNLKEKKLSDKKSRRSVEVDSISNKDIAIIGISGKFGISDNLQEYWECLINKKDCIRSFPEKRKKDLKNYLNHLKNFGFSEKELEFKDGAYLSSIDKFDFKVFSISPKEADLMDPNQRLFLETAWAAIEDSGYGGKGIYGTKTGVYVAYNGDNVEDYKKFILLENPSLNGLSVSGNVKSMVATRISYLLDLKGPALLVDTACSSALMAIHMACCGIKNGDCDMAIAGGIKIDLVPIKGQEESNIGIGSSDGKTKTFDDASDGTGNGEGVAALILKPLSKAMEDKDNIYAVIKASAVNQDGSSIGITAPNSQAQQDVIVDTWRSAGINPETISYFEAHGTGTKLGDPIEIAGIEGAFKKFTDRKQFCAIGSVKSNIGHLDNAAGMAGIIKCILSLKNKTLLPTIHLNSPNRKINFESSPVYISDRVVPWKTKGNPRRCNISSFGISGTNCNILLEEAPSTDLTRLNDVGNYILTISAPKLSTLKELVNRYAEFYIDAKNIDLGNICYTANTGREHYSQRLAIVFKDEQDFKDKISKLATNWVEKNDKEIFYKQHRVVSQKDENDDKEILESEKKYLNLAAIECMEEYEKEENFDKKNSLLCKLAYIYVSGADITWEKIYIELSTRKVKIPTYPFDRKRCWYDRWTSNNKQVVKNFNYKGEEAKEALFDTMVETMDTTIYSTVFSIHKHWILREHRIGNNYVIPGTTYIEMACEALRKYCTLGKVLKLKSVMFLTTLLTNKIECNEVKSIVKNEESHMDFCIMSKNDDSWIKHVEAKGYLINKQEKSIDIDKIKKGLPKLINIDYSKKQEGLIKLGERWNNTDRVYIGEDAVLAHLFIPKKYEGDLDDFYLHPSLLDSAVNVASHSVKGGFYLPFSYGEVRIYSSLPKSFYSYVKKKGILGSGSETATFDIVLCNDDGLVLVEIEDYVIKKVHKTLQENTYYNLKWIKENKELSKEQKGNNKILIFKDEKAIGDDIINNLKCQYIEVKNGKTFKRISEKEFEISGKIEDYYELFNDIKEENITHILHLQSIVDNMNKDIAQFEEDKEKSIYSLFNIIKALSNNKNKKEIKIILITQYGISVTKEERYINALASAIIGFGRVIAKEYSTIKCKNIDIDEGISVNTLLNEIMYQDNYYSVAYRNNERYIEQLTELQTEDIEKNSTSIDEKGAYIITGGTGGIGLEVSKYLSSKNNKVKICLLSRSVIPKKSEWGSILEKSEDKKLKNIIKSITEIEQNGSEVSVYSVDVSNFLSLKKVLEDIRNKYEKINGIIHSAGVAGGGYLVNKSKEQFEAVTSAKINGTFNLDYLTANDNLQFMIVFSSMASILGLAGQSDYVTANAYLNGFSDNRNSFGKNTICINWASWSEVGMAKDYQIDYSKEMFKPIDSKEGIEFLNEILCKGIKKSYIGRFNLNVAKKMIGYSNFSIEPKLVKQFEDESSLKKIKKSYNKDLVEISSKKNVSTNSIEKTIAKMWNDVLGIDEVNINDNFYDLGGDSIMATQLLKIMQKEFPGLVDISDIFTYASIKEMSKYLNSKMKKEENILEIDVEEDLDKILKRLANGEITVDEADLLMEFEENE
ncbi:type I polyketide synthase [Clostridium felsineum]|uniref:type I polyketide synthase n=1 Tax=Clostridium felsineum TaxID=36839 RepID=UPI00098C6AEB|nr:type I polyketide synthase [Clostridium felsineum]URZ00314.1 Polyketide synthase PksN [Clostridium felsineum]